MNLEDYIALSDDLVSSKVRIFDKNTNYIKANLDIIQLGTRLAKSKIRLWYEIYKTERGYNVKNFHWIILS